MSQIDPSGVRIEMEPDRPAELYVEVTEHDVALAGLPDAAVGLRVAQLSDFHRGRGGTDELIMESVRIANELDADYILMTGDFVNEGKGDILPAVKMVSALRARRGVYAILGNHDHRSDPVLLRSALEAAGITVLDNTAVPLVEGFWLAGVDDLYEGDGDLKPTLEPIPPGAAAILLSHNPLALDKVDPNRPLVILSGHTHGAQIRLRFPSPELVCWFHLRTRYVQGWYRRGQVRLYVNRGIGVTGPWPLNRRHNCLPEISLFRLQQAK